MTAESLNRTQVRNDMFAMSKDAEPVRSYDRTWEEIEVMLEKATARMIQWKEWYEECKTEQDKEGMKEAARNHKALQGVVKTLKWTLGEEGVADPLN